MKIVGVFTRIATMDEVEILKDFSERFGAFTDGEFFSYKEGDDQLPLLVAHTDTVATIPPTKSEILYDHRQKVIIRKPTTTWNKWDAEPLGADDRLGVAMIYLLLQQFPNAPALLLNYEECGGYGAKQAASVLKEELQRYPYLIELDRSGCRHFAHYGYITNEFREFMLSLLPNWQFRQGTFTDISILCPAIKRCGVNIAIGYYNQHTPHEFVELQHTMKALNAVQKLLSNPVDKPFVCHSQVHHFKRWAWEDYLDDYEFQWELPDITTKEIDTEEWLKEFEF